MGYSPLPLAMMEQIIVSSKLSSWNTNGFIYSLDFELAKSDRDE